MRPPGLRRSFVGPAGGAAVAVAPCAAWAWAPAAARTTTLAKSVSAKRREGLVESVEEAPRLAPRDVRLEGPPGRVEEGRHAPQAARVALAHLRGEEGPRRVQHPLPHLFLPLRTAQRQRARGQRLHLLHQRAHVRVGRHPLRDLRRRVELIALQGTTHVVGLGGGEGGRLMDGLHAVVAQRGLQVRREGRAGAQVEGRSLREQPGSLLAGDLHAEAVLQPVLEDAADVPPALLGAVELQHALLIRRDDLEQLHAAAHHAREQQAVLPRRRHQGHQRGQRLRAGAGGAALGASGGVTPRERSR